MLTLRAEDIAAYGDALVIRTREAARLLAEVESGKKYDLTLKRHRKKRSLSANSMYWSILPQFAHALRVSNNYAHNLLLRRYGQLEYYDDGEPAYMFIPDTDEAAGKADEAETYHIKPTSNTKVGKNGKTYREYKLLRGSKTYDTAEFSRLLNGLLDECRQMGLEVLSESERALLEGYDGN